MEKMAKTSHYSIKGTPHMGLFDWLKFKKTAQASNPWRNGDRVLAKWADSYYPGQARQCKAMAAWSSSMTAKLSGFIYARVPGRYQG